MAITCNHCAHTWEPKIRPGQRAILCSKCHYPVRLTKTPIPVESRLDDEFIHSEMMMELMLPTPIPMEQLPMPPSPPVTRRQQQLADDLAPVTKLHDLDQETDAANTLNDQGTHSAIYDQKTPLDYTTFDGTQVLELDKETTDVTIEAPELDGMIGELLDQPVLDFHDEHTSFIRVQDSSAAETIIRPVEQERYSPEEDVTFIHSFAASPKPDRVLPPDQTMVMKTEGVEDRLKQRGDIHAEGTQMHTPEDIEAFRTEAIPSQQGKPKQG